MMAAMETAVSESGLLDTDGADTPDGCSLLSAAARTGLLVVHRVQPLERTEQV